MYRSDDLIDLAGDVVVDVDLAVHVRRVGQWIATCMPAFAGSASTAFAWNALLGNELRLAVLV